MGDWDVFRTQNECDNCKRLRAALDATPHNVDLYDRAMLCADDDENETKVRAILTAIRVRAGMKP